MFRKSYLSVELSSYAAKWPEGIIERGFVMCPKCLITCMGDLGLKPQEAIVLFNLIEKCWFAGDVAYPKIDTIAKNIGRKNSATREILRCLAAKGFLSKTQRYNSSNIYDLEPTAKKLAEHMEHCRYAAGSSTQYRQITDSHHSQKNSDYLETNKLRNIKKEINIVPSPILDVLQGYNEQWNRTSADKDEARNE